MAFVLKDRVKGWTNTTGEDNFVIFATQDGFQPFSVIGNGNETYYTIFDPNNYDWETGIGTFTASTQTLSRDTILSSSNNNAKVVFLLGTKEVFVGYPAEKAVTLDTAQTVSNKTLTSATITGSTINSTSVGATTPATGAFTTLVASGASITSINAGVALLTTATVTSLTATGASIASANIGNLQFTAASVASINAGVAVITNLTATSASIASANVATAVITTGTVTNLTSTSASIASMNAGVALLTTATVTNLTATDVSAASAKFVQASITSANVGVALLTTATVTNLTATGASIASANIGNLQFTGASVASMNIGTAFITTLTATSASIASANIGVALVTTGTVTNLTATGASIASANAGTAIVTNLQVTGASAASANFGLAVIAAGTAAAPKLTTTGDLDTGMYFPAANEVAVSAGGTVAAGFNSNGLFFRNRIINGDMRIAQRGTAAVTTSSGFPVDRTFAVNQTDGAFSAQQDTSVPTGAGFTNSIKWTTTTADGTLTTTQQASFTQGIEGNNIADFAWGTANARPVTLSFWARSSLTGTFSGALKNFPVTRSYPFTYTISSANTWEYKTITIPGETTGTWATDNSNGVIVVIALGAGPDRSGTANAWASSNVSAATGAVSVIGTLNATFYITGLQLETGSVATPFERRPYGTELMLCQRYCVLIASGVNKPIANSFYYTATNLVGYLSFPVDMRTTPTLSVVTGTSYYGNVANGGIDGLDSLTQDIRNERGITIYNNTEAAGTAGHGGYLYSQNAAGQVLVTAEL